MVETGNFTSTIVSIPVLDKLRRWAILLTTWGDDAMEPTNKKMEPTNKKDERRRAIRVTLIGPARFGPKGRAERAVSAVLDNANRIGAGFHAKEPLDAGESVTVAVAFLDQKDREQQEKLSGRIAWVKPWEKGFLIGVVWDHTVTKEKNPWLYDILDMTLKETA